MEENCDKMYKKNYALLQKAGFGRKIAVSLRSSQ